MKRSLNEVRGIVLKAARGAGQPLGVAEKIAAASVHLYEIRRLPEWIKSDHPAACCAALDLALCGECAEVSVECREFLEAVVAQHNCQHKTHLEIVVGSVLNVRPAAAPFEPKAPIGPRDMLDSTWNALTELASKTYVPATEASRLAGAGAGLTDND